MDKMTDDTILQIIQRTIKYLNDVEQLIKNGDNRNSSDIANYKKSSIISNNYDDEEDFAKLSDEAQSCLDECLRLYNLPTIDIYYTDIRHRTYYLGLFEYLYNVLLYGELKQPLRQTKILTKRAMITLMSKHKNDKTYTNVDVLDNIGDELSKIVDENIIRYNYPHL